MASTQSTSNRNEAVIARARELGLTVQKLTGPHGERFVCRVARPLTLGEFEARLDRLEESAAAYERIEALNEAYESLSPKEIAERLGGHLWTVCMALSDTDPDGSYVVTKTVTIENLRWLLAEAQFLDMLIPDRVSLADQPGADFEEGQS